MLSSLFNSVNNQISSYWVQPTITNNSFHINADNTLKYPDGHLEEIISSTRCMGNPSECYEMIPNSPFGTTKKTLEFYKKTKEPKGNTLEVSRQILTTVVVPTGAQIRFELGSSLDYRGKCVDMAIVRNQKFIDTGEPVTESNSIAAPLFENVYIDGKISPNFNFKYIDGNLVRPTNPYYNYDMWNNDPILNKIEGNKMTFPIMNNSGIHVFSSEVFAENCMV